MKWLNKIFMKLFPQPDHGPTEEDLDRARKARERSEHEFQEIKDQRSEVDRIARQIREIRQANHLAEIFERSLRKGGGPDHA